MQGGSRSDFREPWPLCTWGHLELCGTNWNFYWTVVKKIGGSLPVTVQDSFITETGKGNIFAIQARLMSHFPLQRDTMLQMKWQLPVAHTER